MSLTARAASKWFGAAAAAEVGVPADVLSPPPQPNSAAAQSRPAAVLVVARPPLDKVGEALAGGGKRGRHVIAGDLVRLVAAQDPAGDRLAVDLVGPVVDAGRAGEAVHALERHVAGVAQRAVDLDRAVDDV